MEELINFIDDTAKEYVCDHSKNKILKVGILTYFGAHNFGAFLQAYALVEIVKRSIDGEIELINFRTRKEINAYSVRKFPLCRPRIFFKNMILFNYNKLQSVTSEKSIARYQTLSKEKLVSDSIEEFTDFVDNRYDLVIAGSDEIWKVDGFRSFPNVYWLPNITCKKMAYAVSSRNTIDSLTDEQIALIKKYIEGFDYIGTRDYSTLNLIAELSTSKKKYYLNCDPTFLYDFSIDIENGKRILWDKYKINSSKKIIGLVLSNAQYGHEISESLNNNFEVISLSSYIDGAKNFAELSPFDWIDVLASCDMIITSRFHGAVFSIKNCKPFLAIEMDGYSKETSKLYDLLERNNLNRFYVESGVAVSSVLSQYIPEFIAFSEHVKYNVDYKNVTDSEKSMAESFINKLQDIRNI